MKQSKLKLRVATKSSADQWSEQPLFATNPEAALPLLSMIEQAQLSIDDLLGQLSRQFIEQLLVLSAQSVAGAKHRFVDKFVPLIRYVSYPLASWL